MRSRDAAQASIQLYPSASNPTLPFMTVNSHRDLLVWQKALVLAKECHAVAHSLPRGKGGVIAHQLDRAAVSVPANIAEGNGRIHKAEYLHHLSISHGSLAEVESHLRLIEAIGYGDAPRIARAIGMCREVGRMLGGLIRSLQATTSDSR
jgi:four helix bundle protein